jgi:DNA-binding CsgD family transcriptional regulator
MAHAIMQQSKGPLVMAEVGLVLMDLSLKLIAFDRGAAAILNYSNQPGVKPDAAACIPKEILDAIRGRKPADLASVKAHFRVGKSEFICRAYLVEPNNGSMTHPVVALHLEKVSSASDTIVEVAGKYGLTEREQEVLRGISMGLANKELADRMSISPNTVKAFLRLIMIKMGVTTRAGIVANILHNGTTLGDQATMGDEQEFEDENSNRSVGVTPPARASARGSMEHSERVHTRQRVS